MKSISLYIFSTIFFIIGIVVFPGGSLIGQENCELSLQKARIKFDQGNFVQVISLLKDCAYNNFSELYLSGQLSEDFLSLRKSSKIEMLELIGQSYLELGDRFSALEKGFYPIIKLSRIYRPEEGRVTHDWLDLTNDFKTYSIFSVYLYGGINASQPSTSEVFSLDSVSIDNEELISTNSTGGNYQFGVGLTYSPPGKKLTFSIEGQYQSNSFSYRANYGNAVVFDEGQRLRLDGRLTFNERLEWFNVPISVKYNMNFGKGLNTNQFGGYLFGGGALGVLSKGEIQNPNLFFPSISKLQSLPLPSIVDLRGRDELRRSLHFQVMAGFGLTYGISPTTDMFIEYRFSRTINNLVNEDERFSSDVLIDPFNYVDNDFVVNTHAFSVGIKRAISFKARQISNLKE